MKQTKHALLVGVGGQGAILTAKVLVNGLMRAGYDVKMSEVHGMSQRGGSVSTQVHWGEKVYSPVIGKGAADIVLAFEKMEAAIPIISSPTASPSSTTMPCRPRRSRPVCASTPKAVWKRCRSISAASL